MAYNSFKSVFVYIIIFTLRHKTNATIMWPMFFTKTIVNPSLSKYVKLGVTEGLPYEVLQARGCPCGRDMYYAEYRYFFWRLSIERE